MNHLPISLPPPLLSPPPPQNPLQLPTGHLRHPRQHHGLLHTTNQYLRIMPQTLLLRHHMPLPTYHLRHPHQHPSAASYLDLAPNTSPPASPDPTPNPAPSGSEESGNECNLTSRKLKVNIIRYVSEF